MRLHFLVCTVGLVLAVPALSRGGATYSIEQFSAASGEAHDSFGWSVAVSGDLMIVGAPYEDGGTGGVNGVVDNAVSSAGAAYAFVRVEGDWVQEAYLKPTQPHAGGHFGWAVAIDGDTAVIGAPDLMGSAGDGSVYVFVREAGTGWMLEDHIEDPAPVTFDDFGISVAISGDTLAIGDPTTFGSTVWVYTRDRGEWSLEATLPEVEEFRRFGTSVALSGDTLAVGAPAGTTSVSESGVHLYERAGTAWMLEQTLTVGVGDQFGWALALEGDTLVAGAPGDDGSGAGVDPGSGGEIENSGAAYVFVRDGETWTQQAFMKSSEPMSPSSTQRGFGESVALDGDWVLVGGPKSGLHIPGAAYQFQRVGSDWIGPKYVANISSTSIFFGSSVAVEDDEIFVTSTFTCVDGSPGQCATLGDGLVQVSPAAPCGPASPSAQVVRLAPGAASPDFLPAPNGPVVGTVWDPRVDHETFIPFSLLDFVVFSASATAVDLGPGGWLLCDAPILSTLQTAEPGERFRIPFPPHCAFVGVTLCAQAGSLWDGGSYAFTNALDITIGDF